jgi:hypothetical protein
VFTRNRTSGDRHERRDRQVTWRIRKDPGRLPRGWARPKSDRVRMIAPGQAGVKAESPGRCRGSLAPDSLAAGGRGVRHDGRGVRPSQPSDGRLPGARRSSRARSRVRVRRSAQAMKSVSSPAIEPTASGQRARSRAAAMAWADPGSVRSTSRWPASRISTGRSWKSLPQPLLAAGIRLARRGRQCVGLRAPRDRP